MVLVSTGNLSNKHTTSTSLLFHSLINSEFKTIKTALLDKIEYSDKPPVIISADANVKYQSVVRLLDILRQLELVKITYATQILKDEKN